MSPDRATFGAIPVPGRFLSLHSFATKEKKSTFVRI